MIPAPDFFRNTRKFRKHPGGLTKGPDRRQRLWPDGAGQAGYIPALLRVTAMLRTSVY